MLFSASPHRPKRLAAMCQKTGLMVAFSRRRLGLREFLCGTVGELMGLQIGIVIGFHLVATDLLPENWHHVAWYLALSLGALAGGAGGWYIARLSRQKPPPQKPAIA